MLRMRKNNLRVLSEGMERGMPARVVRYVRIRYAHVFGRDDAPAIRALVERVIAAAKPYGITEGEDVALFADLSIMYGEDFHKDEWALGVLTSSSLTPRQKMLELRDRVHESGALL